MLIILVGKLTNLRINLNQYISCIAHKSQYLLLFMIIFGVNIGASLLVPFTLWYST